MKKSIIAIIVIIILILVAVYVVGMKKIEPDSMSLNDGIQQGQGTENFVQDVQNIDLGNIDQEFQPIDSDLNTL